MKFDNLEYKPFPKSYFLNLSKFKIWSDYTATSK